MKFAEKTRQTKPPVAANHLPRISGWYPTEGANCGRIESMYLSENHLTIKIIFCDGAAFLEHTTIVLDSTSSLFTDLCAEARNYTGSVRGFLGDLWEFDYMKIILKMTEQGPAPWFLRPRLQSLKIVPWPVWFDNRPKRCSKGA